MYEIDLGKHEMHFSSYRDCLENMNKTSALNKTRFY